MVFTIFPLVFPWFPHGSHQEASSAVDLAKLAAAQVAPEGSKICRGAQGGIGQFSHGKMVVFHGMISKET